MRVGGVGGYLDHLLKRLLVDLHGGDGLLNLAEHHVHVLVKRLGEGWGEGGGPTSKLVQKAEQAKLAER